MPFPFPPAARGRDTAEQQQRLINLADLPHQNNQLLKSNFWLGTVSKLHSEDTFLKAGCIKDYNVTKSAEEGIKCYLSG